VESFALDADDLCGRLRAAAQASGATGDAVVARARAGAALDLDDLAVLWNGPLDAPALYALACRVRARRTVQLETFSPLYMTNTCDAECRMCGMRRDNDALRRETVDLAAVDAQLDVLQRRGMHGVALLTGEYRRENRTWALGYVNQALRRAVARGFRHVLINVGALDSVEYETLLAGLPVGDAASPTKLTMCTFQETYSREHYGRFMGTSDDNPRADFDRRLANFDRARAAGLRVANPGILVGLDPDLGFELLALATHAHHLLGHGMEVYLSVPRLRQIAGRDGAAQRGADDASFIRLVSILSLGLPDAKIVLTTREPAHIQRLLVPLITVLSAGSAAVAPYTDDGARFPLESSQFEVIDQRPFEAILGEHLQPGTSIDNFEP
jgi:2-iminoacetate synthase ThiH